MSTIKRDKLAEEFSLQGWDERFKEELAAKVKNYKDEEFDFRSVYVAREIEKRSFKAGYDAGFTEAQEQAKVLVDEMTIAAGFVEVYDTSGTMSKMIDRALEQYRKATNDE